MRRLNIPALALLASPALADHEFDGADLAEGALLYQDHCAACHGAELRGQPDWRSPGADGLYPAPPHDQTGHTWHHPTAMLFEYTKLGGQEALARAGVTSFTSGMPAFGDQLSDRQIIDILAWIASTWPDRLAASQRARNPEH